MRRGAQSPVAAIVGSTIAALLLAVFPLPGWLMPARPEWLALLVIYWITRTPTHFGMTTAWLLGLLMDGIAGALLGPRALALAVVAYLALVVRPRMLHYTLLQQMAVVCALTAVGQLLNFWAQGIFGHAPPTLWFLMGSLTTAFCWPIVSMDIARRREMEDWNASG